MKKKCLGCGKIFEDKISICQDCFHGIENVRGQFESFPQGFRRETYLSLRKITLWMAVFIMAINITASLLMIPFVCTIAAKLRCNPFSIFANLYLPSIILFTIGFCFRDFFGKFAARRLIKMWSDKEWYSVSVRSWRYIKYWLISVLPLFILSLVFLVSYYIFRVKGFSSEIKSIYEILFYIGLDLGFRNLAGGIIIGWMVFNYFSSSNWISKLSK